MVTVRLLPPLTRLVGQKEFRVSNSGGNVKQVLLQLAASNPRLSQYIFDEAGEMVLDFSCLLNQRQCARQELESLKVNDGDEITLLMPIAGG